MAMILATTFEPLLSQQTDYSLLPFIKLYASRYEILLS